MSISIYCIIFPTSSWSHFPCLRSRETTIPVFISFIFPAQFAIYISFLDISVQRRSPKKMKALFFCLIEWLKAQSRPRRPQSRQHLLAIQEAISESFCVQLQLCIQTTPSKLPRLWWNDAICLQGSNSCTARLNLAFPCAGLLIRASWLCVSLLIVPSVITKALPDAQQEAGDNRKWFVFLFQSVDCVQSGQLTNV